jgi:NodT family efflux transporter outer membrane factor (OMF) lipoprotein
MMKRLVLMMAVSLPLLGGCASLPTAGALPAGYESADASTAVDPAAIDAWWMLYGDAELEGLVIQAQASAPDAQLAQSRLAEARALRSAALFNYNPQGNLRGQAGKAETDQLSGGSPFLSTAGETKTAGASFDVSWEIDLFGRRYAARGKANADLSAARFEVEGARASLAANVAQQVFQVRGLDIQLADANETVRIQDALYQMAVTKAERGLVSSSDAERVNADLSQAKAEQARLRAELQAAKRSLLVLVGRGSEPTSALVLTSALGTVPEVPVTVPSSLLQRRPDVRESEARLRSSMGQRTLSRLALFPTFTLLPGVGWSDAQAANYGSTTSFWSLSAGMSVPILDLPRLVQQIKVQNARTKQAAIGYQKTVQTAFGETENTLARLAADRVRVRLLAAGEASGRTAYLAAEKKYAAGLIDLASAMDAERAWRGSRSAMTAAQVTALQRSVQAFKALGGGWPSTPETAGSSR